MRTTFVLSLLFLASATRAAEPLPAPLSQHGTVSFTLHTGAAYKNGTNLEDFKQQTLVSLDGLATIELSRSSSSVDLAFEWNTGRYDRGFHINLPEIPGPDTSFIQFSWDADQGLCEGYFNGAPLALAGTKYAPWKVTGQADHYSIGAGPNTVSNVKIEVVYHTPKELAALVPQELHDKHRKILGYGAPGSAMDVSGRRGDLLYESAMDSDDALKGWVMEGAGVRKFVDGALQMAEQENPPRDLGPGHFVYWCPKDFPDRLVAEWDFEPRSENGLCIVFFGARGTRGQDIFDPALPPRNGTFAQYTNGAMSAYHISYFANESLYQTGRPSSNLRKNPGSMVAANGPIAIAPGKQNKGFVHMRLIKDGPHIQLLANDKVSIDWTDNDTDRYGPPLKDGKIGLRQMNETTGAYKNFKVYALAAPIAATGPAALPRMTLTALQARPQDWFKTDAAAGYLTNVLAWQTPIGGWIKNYSPAVPRKADDVGEWDGAATIDNDATYTELRIIARAYTATQRPDLRAAFDRGLEWLFKAQYDNGGWPQRSPPPDNYGRHITFNDNAMNRVMDLMDDISKGRGDFAFIDQPTRDRAGKAFGRGVDCVLNCQIKVNGKLTGWCAQHDEVTLAPAGARAYELPSISGSEGASIAILLMKIENPDDRIKNAVNAAVAWFDSVKIMGKRVGNGTNAAGQRIHILVDDPNGGPIWARFYDIETNKPFFCNRDGIKHFEYTALDPERSLGYAWYGSWGNQLLKDYDRWKVRKDVVASGAAK